MSDPYNNRGYQFPKAGLNSTGVYQISGKPYLSSSISVPPTTPKKLQFPYVTKFIVVRNTFSGSARPLRFGFSSNGVANLNNYLVLQNGESFSADIRVIDMFLMSDDGSSIASASVGAGVTGIERSNLNHNWSGSVGIG